MTETFKSIGKYLSFIKFSHTVFALPFAITGYAIAVSMDNYDFSLKILLLIILCMVFARNAAMAFNRYADEKYDALNPRTSGREIPSGKISRKSALVFVIVNSLLFIVSAGMINRLTLVLSPVALSVILGYSLTKRFTALCHFILGLSLSLAPTGAYIAVTGRFDILPVVYSLIVLTWASGFDIIYSLQDEDFDRSANLYSIPSVKGRKNGLIISGLLHILTVLLVAAAGLLNRQGILYWAGAGIFSALLVYQHVIVKPSDISRVNLAFATTNGIASVVYAIFVVADLVFLQ